MNYVPYRESKLTTILKQSLGGNSFTLMIACLAPIDVYTEENISTLNYAARAARISNAPAINMDPKLKQIMEQKRTIERLKQELKRANDQVKFLTMGGCVCKLDGNGDADSKQLQATSSGLTINNNYSNNNISIIDGTSAATATFAGGNNLVDDNIIMFNGGNQNKTAREIASVSALVSP